MSLKETKEIIVGYVFPEILLPIIGATVMGGTLVGWFFILTSLWNKIGVPESYSFLLTFPLVLFLSPLTLFLLGGVMGVFRSPTGTGKGLFGVFNEPASEESENEGSLGD
jgi:hypothetical protein